MKKALFILTLSLISCASLHAQCLDPASCTTASCSDSNFVSFTNPLSSDRTEHVVPSDGGDHHFGSFFTFSCNYQSNAIAPTQYCVTTSATQAEITSTNESGELTNILFSHFIGANAKGGLTTAVNGAVATTGGMTAGAVEDCFSTCDVNITFDASGDGVGIKVNFPPSTVWTHEVPQGISCGAVLDPNFVGDCTPLVKVGGIVMDADTDPVVCSTPIIIDTEGEGFYLTSAENGVTFDIHGDGRPLRIAWTAPGHHNAFLALDRDGSGTITSGKELFGNVTAQPVSGRQNGFLALAEFDKPENGGNGDGVIDEQDGVFSKLVLWIDDNHDGISQTGELYHLADFGIHSLSVSYFESRKRDEFGNLFRYKARVNPRKGDRDSRDEKASGEVGRWAYDVFFVTK